MGANRTKSLPFAGLRCCEFELNLQRPRFSNLIFSNSEDEAARVVSDLKTQRVVAILGRSENGYFLRIVEAARKNVH